MSGEGRPATVRPATVEDANAITEVHVTSWQAGYRGILPAVYLDGLSDEEEARRAQWRVRIGAPDEPGTQTWVALLEDKVAGFAVCGRARDDDVGPEVGELHAMYVHPEVWRSGAGSALMVVTLEQMTQGGYTEAMLWVFEENGRARGFYERHGWRVDGSTHIFERGGTQTLEVRYRRPLP